MAAPPAYCLAGLSFDHMAVEEMEAKCPQPLGVIYSSAEPRRQDMFSMGPLTDGFMKGPGAGAAIPVFLGYTFLGTDSE